MPFPGLTRLLFLYGGGMNGLPLGVGNTQDVQPGLQVQDVQGVQVLVPGTLPDQLPLGIEQGKTNWRSHGLFNPNLIVGRVGINPQCLGCVPFYIHADDRRIGSCAIKIDLPQAVILNARTDAFVEEGIILGLVRGAITINLTNR